MLRERTNVRTYARTYVRINTCVRSKGVRRGIVGRRVAFARSHVRVFGAGAFVLRFSIYAVFLPSFLLKFCSIPHRTVPSYVRTSGWNHLDVDFALFLTDFRRSSLGSGSLCAGFFSGVCEAGDPLVDYDL